MTDQEYMRIIASLFQITGYATGVLSGMTYHFHNDELLSKINHVVQYLEDQQKFILSQMDDTK